MSTLSFAPPAPAHQHNHAGHQHQHAPHQHAHQHTPALGVQAQPNLMTVVQTPQGPQWAPYNPQALGQVGAGMSLATKLALGVGLFFLGRWVWQKMKNVKADNDDEEEIVHPRRSRLAFGEVRAKRRSRSRMLGEFKRFLETHAEEE